jgi:excisionase family DNA binding protein
MVAARKFTTAEAAELVGCNVETLRRAIRKHELLATREPTKRGRSYLILAVDLNAWVQKRRLG